MTDPLIADLEAAEATSTLARTECPMCDAIDRAETDERAEALRRAAAGTIGIARLVKILRNNDIEVGRVLLARHREEKHS